MSLDMALFRALVFVASAIILIAVTQRPRVHPFVAIVAVAVAFSYAAQLRTALIGRVFGVGFSEMIYSPGLVIVAAGLIAAVAEGAGASQRLTAMVESRGGSKGSPIVATLGLIAGLGASASAAFALLSPLLRPICGKTRADGEAATVTLALAISASHGLAVLSPVAIASISILGADWGRTALLGLPLAIILVGFAAVFARKLPAIGAAPPDEKSTDAASPTDTKSSAATAIMFVLATIIPVLMLIFSSIADIPSEPLGGEPGLEFIVTVGEPLILLLVGVGLMIVAQPRRSLGFLADSARTGRFFGGISTIVLVVCAAGGLQALCQQTRMAETLGEHVLEWHGGAVTGLVIVFLVAAALKTLQGSSLVGAITAAGMVQPLLAPLGLADVNGKALAALAVGAGAMTVSHVNDEYFWLVALRAGFSPLRGVATISLGTLLQGLVALAMLLLVCAMIPHV